MLKWENVTFSYEQGNGNDVLAGVELELEPGRVSVVTGPSGCGKSTLLYLAAGLYPQNAGELKGGRITLDGQDVGDIRPGKRARMVGMMFQNPDLQFCMDTLENELVFCLENVGMEPGRMDEAIAGALEFAGIPHLRDRLLSTLSGGEKQKAMLACIVALRPAWLLLDEPFANIDTDTAEIIAGKLGRMNREFGTGIVAVDHQVGTWLDIADEVIVVGKRGAVTQRGITPENMRQGRLEMYGVALPWVAYQEEKPVKRPEAAEAVLSLRGVRVAAGEIEILEGCSADFYRGRIHAVIGESGSGKSTLFGALSRINRYGGSICLEGRELKKIRRTKLGEVLGFVFQNPQDQFVSNSVMGEIAAGLKKKMGADEVDARVEQILRGIGLWRYRFVSPYMLSQGQQRRLAVAALLACGCRILVCDEPTYAQDRESLVAIMDALQRRVTEQEMTLVFSTHDKKLAREYADYIYEIRGGAVYAVDPSGI